MLVFRSLTLGLLGACLMLLIARPTEIRVIRETKQSIAVPPAIDAPIVIDVAAGVSNAQLAALIRIAPGEHIAAIDDIPIGNDLSAGVVLASLALQSLRYIDLEISGPAGERRVLVLLH